MNQLMRALAVRQPYAERIIRGSKKIEYRSKPTKLRERVYVYACKNSDDISEATAYEVKEGRLALGVIIGTVEIRDCRKRRGVFEWILAKPRRAKQYRKPLGMPQPGIFIPFPNQVLRPKQVSRRTMATTSRFWQHDDVFPIIAEVITQLCQNNGQQVTVKEIAPALLAHRTARRRIDEAADESSKDPEWIARNMVAWLSQTITMGSNRWEKLFDRELVHRRWAYQLKEER
jgi:predicted transcriptional regulator